MNFSAAPSFNRTLPLFVFLCAVFFAPLSKALAQETKTHISSDKIFMITYPVKWKINRMEQAELCINGPGSSLFKPSMIKIEITKLAEGYEKHDIKKLSEVETKMAKSQNTDKVSFTIEESKFEKIKGVEWWIIKGKITQGKEVFLTDSFKAIYKGKVYTVTYLATEKKFEENRAAARSIFDTFEFLAD